MRRILLLPLFLCAVAGAIDTRTEIGFGFPHFFNLRVDLPIASQWRVGLGVGAIPFSSANLIFRPEITADISDEYDLTVSPDLRALSSGLFAEWTSGSGISVVRFEAMLNLIGVTANTYVVNKATGVRAPYMDLDVMAILPRLVVSYGARLQKNETWNLYGGLGLTLLFSNQVVTALSGPAHAYFDAVPSARNSVDDGMTNLENELTSTLSESFFAARLLPAVWISASW